MSVLGVIIVAKRSASIKRCNIYFFPGIVHKLESENYIKFGVHYEPYRALKICATSCLLHFVLLKDLK